jgi:hypothetical protein
MNRHTIASTALVAAYTAIALTIPADASAARHYPDVPRHCHIVGITNPEDEGFPVAKCRNGRYIYADMDGNGKNPKTNGRWQDATFYVSLGIHPVKK